MDVDVVTSVRNRRVVAAAALARRRERRRRGRYLVEGPNAVAEAVAAGQAEVVFATAARADAHAWTGVEVVVVADHVLERLADSRSPQGVVAVARTVTAELADVVGDGVLVVLVEPADPGNLGTIVRTADAAGAVGVVVTGDPVDGGGWVDPWNPKAVRASAGSVCHLPLVVGPAVADVVAACHAAGQRVVALDASAGTDVAVLGDDDQPVAVLLGNEAHGLPATALELADDRLAVPIHGRAESLNLAAAAAVTLYAAARGRHHGTATATGRAGRPTSADETQQRRGRR